MGTRTGALSNILFSGSRRSILTLLYSHADEQFYLREIARRAGTGIRATQRELRQLSEAGLIQDVRRGRQVYYQGNRKNPIFSEVKSILARASGIRVLIFPATEECSSFGIGDGAGGENSLKKYDRVRFHVHHIGEATNFGLCEWVTLDRREVEVAHIHFFRVHKVFFDIKSDFHRPDSSVAISLCKYGGMALPDVAGSGDPQRLHKRRQRTQLTPPTQIGVVVG